jgi:hypothetical protein
MGSCGPAGGRRAGHWACEGGTCSARRGRPAARAPRALRPRPRAPPRPRTTVPPLPSTAALTSGVSVDAAARVMLRVSSIT